ncbi:uncharacterized protein [Haliotis cracherodii]|uniref:uncharacterized protein isoform X2 n=1 Tax=Haliotis cracherodii TaxID=6455 RepID=UPI0039EB540A
MSTRLNAKTRSDMGGKRSRGDENGGMTADMWGDVYDMLCAKIKADDMYTELRSKMWKLSEPQKVAPVKTIKKTQKKKTTTTPATTAAAAGTETKGTSFLKPATPATPAKRRSRKKLSLKIAHQEQLTPDVSSAQSVLEQWWKQTPREPTYSPNAPVMLTTGDSEDNEALKLATLPSMDLDTLPLLGASWSPASPEDVFSSGRS